MNDRQSLMLRLIEKSGFIIMCTLPGDRIKTLIRYPEGIYCLLNIEESGSLSSRIDYYSTLSELQSNVTESAFLELLQACSVNDTLSEDERIDFSYALSLLSK